MPRSLSQEFADACAVHLPGDAPKDGRWFDTDEPFEIVAWVPSSWTYDDLVKTYG